MGVSMPRARPVTMADALLRSGIASGPGTASMLLAILAFCCIAGAIYFLASAVPKAPPQLGSDVLRQGESIPNYVH